jgi:hypothetical protein
MIPCGRLREAVRRMASAEAYHANPAIQNRLGPQGRVIPDNRRQQGLSQLSHFEIGGAKRSGC